MTSPRPNENPENAEWRARPRLHRRRGYRQSLPSVCSFPEHGFDEQAARIRRHTGWKSSRQGQERSETVEAESLALYSGASAAWLSISGPDSITQ